MIRNQAIGIFDSGCGGLTVVKEIIKTLPHEKIIYFGDTARVPYGNKSKKTVTKFSIDNTEFLLKFSVKIIVIACNTSCSLSINALKRKYDTPIIGVISSAVKKAYALSGNKRIGVIGTRSTILSKIYEKRLKSIDKKVKVYSESCPLFVPLVEENWVNEKITRDIARKYLAPLKRGNIDTLILGCTHYPLLVKTIQKIMGKKIKLVNSAKEVARDVKKILQDKRALRESRGKTDYVFYVSDEPERFKKLAVLFLGRKIKHVREV